MEEQRSPSTEPVTVYASGFASYQSEDAFDRALIMEHRQATKQGWRRYRRTRFWFAGTAAVALGAFGVFMFLHQGMINLPILATLIFGIIALTLLIITHHRQQELYVALQRDPLLLPVLDRDQMLTQAVAISQHLNVHLQYAKSSAQQRLYADQFAEELIQLVMAVPEPWSTHEVELRRFLFDTIPAQLEGRLAIGARLDRDGVLQVVAVIHDLREELQRLMAKHTLSLLEPPADPENESQQLLTP